MATHDTTKQSFSGTVTAMKARIRLLRSFDQISHRYLGYTLVLDGTLDDIPTEELRIAIGPKAHEKHQVRIGDQVTGLAIPVPDPREEWATHHKVSRLRVLSRGPLEQDVPANPDAAIAPRCPYDRGGSQ